MMNDPIARCNRIFSIVSDFSTEFALYLRSKDGCLRASDAYDTLKRI